MRRSREHLLIVALAALACLRVELLAAAFPFFGSMDEQAHVDLVHKFSRGYWPRQHDEPFDAASIAWFVAYGTVEYLSPPGVAPPPLWRLPRAEAAARVRALAAYWRASPNWEKGSPPVYYALLGLWLRLGTLLGLSRGTLLYWLRVPNGFFVAAAVVLTWLLARRVAPERPEVRLGAPLLLAVLPQSVFYFVNCDNLSLPLGVATLLVLLVWIDDERAMAPVATAGAGDAARASNASLALPAIAGLLVAAAVLTKLTNLPLLVLLIVAAAVLVVRRRGARGPALAQAAIAIACAAVPLLLWLLRNHRLLGDWTGDADKAREQGVTRLDLHGMLAHPLFTPRGAWTFLRDLLADLWRGEVLWHGRPLGASRWDALFVATSLLFLAAAAMATVRAMRMRAASPASAMARAFCWLHVVGSIGLLALLSISFDYGNCVNPSRDHPYFTSARLIAGAMPAFLVLYAWGSGTLLSRVRRPWTMTLVIGVALVATAAGARFVTTVASSAYDAFHLP